MAALRRRIAMPAVLAAALLSGVVPGPSASADGPSIAVTVDRGAPEQGSVFRVALRAAPPPDNASIRWRDRDWPMRGCGPGCFEAFAGVDLEDPPGRRPLSVSAWHAGERAGAEVGIEVGRRDFPTQALTIPPEKDVLDEALVRRVEEEAAALKQRFDAAPAVPAWDSPFLPPVPAFLPSRFGARRVINGIPRNPHTGGDMTLPEGTPVRSVADGRVAFSGEQFFGGHELVVDHGGGVFSMYFHLSERSVGEGQAVRRGERIGSVGATGRATGPHLHFGLRVTGARVDPAALPGIVDKP